MLRSDSPSVVGDNGVRPLGWVTTIKPHQRVCTPLGSASSPPDAIRVTVGVAGAGAQPLALTFPGSSERSVLRDYPDGPVELRIPDHVAAGTACIGNRGHSGVYIAGEGLAGSTLHGEEQPFMVSYILVSHHPPSWSSVLGRVLRHVGQARAGAGGSATGWIVLALAVAMVATAVGAAARWAR
ncbi:MAG TPA: hypothetical protein VFT50_06400 [Baekduia sp.]|nr:hypothetical protein [Baekduia sp.]